MFKRVLGLIAIAGLALGLSGCGFNTIPTKEEVAKAKWSDVQIAYQRRAELIPQLVATVKGAAKQETSTLVAVTEARAKATQISVDASTITDPAKFQQFAAAQDGLSSALGRLMVIQERYPELQTNQNFLGLMSEVSGTQNRIAIAQRDYNDAARDYNTTLRTFPGIIWAKTAYSGNKPMEYFKAAESSTQAPTIDFSDVGASK